MYLGTSGFAFLHVYLKSVSLTLQFGSNGSFSHFLMIQDFSPVGAD